MLITTTQELNLYIPNNLLPSVDMISGFLEQAENTFVKPVLGVSLYDKLVTEYNAMDDKSVLLPGSTVEQTPWVKLIKAVQCAAIFYALYDGAEFLNVTITSSGMSQISTDGMGPASEPNVSGFKKASKIKALQAKDQLYLLLEEDATAETPVFGELWTKSSWYSITQGRLITTASQFQRFVDIYESREKFVSLSPDIAFCENIHIRPGIGAAFTQSLIELQSKGKLTAVQKEAVEQLQMALALFVEARNKMFSRPEAKEEAVLTLNLAKDFIRNNQSSFTGIIESSPLYVAPLAEQPVRDAWVNNKPGDQIFVIGGRPI